MSKFGTWNQRLQICLIVKSSEEEKCPNLGPKMPYLGVFRPELKKNYCHIWNQHPWICLNAKYHEIIKMPKVDQKWFTRVFLA